MRRAIFLTLSLIVVTLIGIRYYVVNKGIPKEYYGEKYSMNEYVKLEGCELKVNSYDVNMKGDTHTDIILNVSIKNTSDNTIDLKRSPLNENTLSIDSIPSDMCIINNIEEDSEIKAGETVNVEILAAFNGLYLEKINDFKEIKFYIAKKCYVNEIESYFNNGKFYAKYIEL